MLLAAHLNGSVRQLHEPSVGQAAKENKDLVASVFCFALHHLFFFSPDVHQQFCNAKVEILKRSSKFSGAMEKSQIVVAGGLFFSCSGSH